MSVNKPFVAPVDLDELVTLLAQPSRLNQLLSLRAAVLCGRKSSSLRTSFGTGKSERDTPLEFNSFSSVDVHFSADRRFFITPSGVSRETCRLVIPSRLSHSIPNDDVWAKFPREAKARSVCVLFLSGFVAFTGEPIAVDASNLTFSASSLGSLLGCFKSEVPTASLEAILYECFALAVQLITPNSADEAAVVAYGSEALLKAPFGAPHDGQFWRG